MARLRLAALFFLAVLFLPAFFLVAFFFLVPFLDAARLLLFLRVFFLPVVRVFFFFVARRLVAFLSEVRFFVARFPAAFFFVFFAVFLFSEPPVSRALALSACSRLRAAGMPRLVRRARVDFLAAAFFPFFFAVIRAPSSFAPRRARAAGLS